MSLFLDVVPLAEAIARARAIAPPMPVEEVPLLEAFGRVLAGDAVADRDIPGFARSTVDGYAVVAADTVGAGEAMPAMLARVGRVNMGRDAGFAVRPGECAYVPTGGILPEGADAMAMIEYAEEVGGEVLVHRAVAPGENVITAGEDFAAGRAVLSKGRRLTSRDLGVLAATGHATVAVSRRPRVGIISTGNELVAVDEAPAGAQVRDVNTFLCAGFVREHGGVPVPYGIVRDEAEALAAALDRALAECDLVLLSGGSSKDDRDMCAATVAAAGEVLVHGIAIAPGKPTIIGRARERPVIGLPGHPASAYVVLIAVVAELLAAMDGEERRIRTVQAVLAQNIPSARGREDYVRVVVDGGTATPLFGKSGLVNTLFASSGVVRVPAAREGLETGETVEVLLW